MLVQLEDGTTTEMSLDKYLAMSDDKFNEICKLGKGEGFINDAFYNSVLQRGEQYDEVDPDLIEDVDVVELLDVSADEKIMDKDFLVED